MMNKRSLFGAVILGLTIAATVLAGAGWADQPRPWQMGMQDPATPVHAQLYSLHNFLLVIITVITLFVLGLLLFTMVRFRAARNPNPSRVAHNTLIEVIWTAVPILILVVIAIPSMRLLYYQDRTHEADMTLKVTAYQWYWGYEYPDNGGFRFESRIVRDDERRPDQPRLLAVDNRAVVPVGANIRVLVTSNDVMHSFFVPSSGVQIYGIVGRTNETWMRFDRPGVYYGQCNQICGVDHGFMPIAIEAVPREQFDRWAAEARQRFAANGDAPVQLANAPAADAR